MSMKCRVKTKIPHKNLQKVKRAFTNLGTDMGEDADEYVNNK